MDLVAETVRDYDVLKDDQGFLWTPTYRWFEGFLQRITTLENCPMRGLEQSRLHAQCVENVSKYLARVQAGMDCFAVRAYPVHY